MKANHVDQQQIKEQSLAGIIKAMKGGELREAERLYERVTPLSPPAAQAEFHGEALNAFRLFLKTADGFYRFGQYARYPERVRVRFLAGAFQDLEKLHLVNDHMISTMLKQVSRYDMIEFEREFADEFNAFKSYLRRDKSTR